MRRNHLFSAAALTALALSFNVAQAASFEHVSSQRGINIGASVGVSAMDDSGFSDSYGEGDGDTFGGYGYIDEAVGLSNFSFSTPYGGGGGSGRASQQSEMTGESIYFNGFADVYVTASSGSEGYANAGGNASSDFNYTFRVDAPLTIRLDMSSSGADEVTGEYWFTLNNNTANSIVWDQTGIEENLQWKTTFTVYLDLAPGEYNVNAHLGASSSFESDFGYSGRALAEFTIAAVPEPGTVAMFALGGLFLGALGWKRSQRA